MLEKKETYTTFKESKTAFYGSYTGKHDCWHRVQTVVIKMLTKFVKEVPNYRTCAKYTYSYVLCSLRRWFEHFVSPNAVKLYDHSSRSNTSSYWPYAESNVIDWPTCESVLLPLMSDCFTSQTRPAVRFPRQHRTLSWSTARVYVINQLFARR